ncbi:maintenance of telomere capping protein 1 [Dendryphion nanum]|uniref:Maintenance of telomere capping protein 1 n=1 Tax=Dendryphion nanum TaxID=256645 RepID=A0A9P9DJX7_9PLEO|nr:maintenance of telomere capping protein 1 [Dendryphion nanum]
MAPKTLEEQLAELEMEAEAPAAPPPKSSKAPKAARKSSEKESDALKELEELEALEKFQRPEIPRPHSRPNTPKLSSSTSTTSSNTRRAGGIATPSSTASARTSEEKPQAPRKSGESARSFHQSFAPTQEEPATSTPVPKEVVAGGGGGGWWGGLLSTATATADAARKKAEAAYQEIQKNQEAQRWAEQVRGNVGALRGIGGELGKRALPTFTNILHTLAPPISQHERLQIHITHDLIGYPSLDPIIYQTFSNVMAQVEGGDLLVIQRGSESTHRRTSVDGYRGGSSGWNDGPWWRDTYSRDLSVVKGLVEGTKLVRISAESYATEFFGARGGVEEAAKQATEVLSESNPVRSSDIFLAIQAVSYPAPEDLFASSTSSEAEKVGGVEEQKEEDELVAFAVYLHDPIHSISFKTLSQSFSAKWVQWIDAPAPTQVEGEEAQMPPEIREIIESGGVDPREWISEWMEETISLSVGIVAQRYVARRMGVGEGGIGRGKAREAVVEAGGGEAARAGII